MCKIGLPQVYQPVTHNIKYFVVIIVHICAHIIVFFLEGLPAKTRQRTNVFFQCWASAEDDGTTSANIGLMS